MEATLPSSPLRPVVVPEVVSPHKHEAFSPLKSSPVRAPAPGWQIKAVVPEEQRQQATQTTPAVVNAEAANALVEQVSSHEAVLKQHTQALKMVAELLVDIKAQSVADRLRSTQERDQARRTANSGSRLGWIVAMAVVLLSFYVWRLPALM